MTGSPTPVVDDVYDPWSGFANYAVSTDGSLLYARGGAQRHDRSLVWVDQKGSSVAAVAAVNPYQSVRLSKDGTRVLLDVDSANTEVWLLDLHRETFSRIVRGWNNHAPIWSPDERHIAFSSSRDTPQGFNVFKMSLDGAGEVIRVTTQPTDAQFPMGWSADGRILFDNVGRRQSDGHMVRVFRCRHAPAAVPESNARIARNAVAQRPLAGICVGRIRALGNLRSSPLGFSGKLARVARWRHLARVVARRPRDLLPSGRFDDGRRGDLVIRVSNRKAKATIPRTGAGVRLRRRTKRPVPDDQTAPGAANRTGSRPELVRRAEGARADEVTVAELANCEVGGFDTGS